MKLLIEDFLHNIDKSFKDKSKKDIYLIYLMIFGIIFSSSYLFLWTPAKSGFKVVKQQIRYIQSELRLDKTYLSVNPKSKLIQLDKEIKSTNAQMLIHKQNNEYIKTKITAISSLIYDEIAWGNYLHSISSKAKDNDIKIIKLTNKYNLNKKSFGHILDITINVSSDYKNTLKFINSLEQSNLVVDIHDLDIKQDDKLYTDLNISVWGIAD